MEKENKDEKVLRQMLEKLLSFMTQEQLDDIQSWLQEENERLNKKINV